LGGLYKGEKGVFKKERSWEDNSYLKSKQDRGIVGLRRDSMRIGKEGSKRTKRIE